MPDNLKQTGKPDDKRINASQEHELAYWAKELGVTREELRSAIENAGPMVDDVRHQLNK
jgi:hypothetical protein